MKTAECGSRTSTAIVFGAIAVVFLFALYGFSGMFLRAYHIFAFAGEEDMTFGWFVPLASLYVLWTKRAALAIAVRVGRFSWAGLAASLPFLVLALLGTRGVQLRLEQLGFIGLCVTLPWTFFGWRCARLFLFPAAYLLFCIPLATFLDFVTIHLRYLASSTAMTVLNGFGLAAVREGTAVISRGAHPFAVDVAEPCSGLRSLFPLMALTAGYAYFNQPTLLRRGLLFVCSIPLAVAGNVARIVSICVIASFSDPKFATGFYHDYSGYIVFIVAILLMMMVNRLIDSVFVARTVPVKRESADAGQPECVAMQPRGVLLPIAATAFFVAVFVFQARTPEATITRAPDVSFPAIAGYTNDDEKFSELQKISEAELNVLPKDTAISKKRMFNFKEKERIGAEAVKMIKDGDFVMFDSGTTTLEVARHLDSFHNLHIITNAMNIATELMNYKRFDVVLLGGNVRVNSHSTVGPLALTVLRNFSRYKLFLGVDSFSIENGISTPSMEEALLNQIMIQQADKVIAVFDSSKFNKRSFVHIADANEIDCIVTDHAIPNGLVSKLKAAGVEVKLV